MEAHALYKTRRGSLSPFGFLTRINSVMGEAGWSRSVSLGVLDSPRSGAEFESWFLREYEGLLRFAFFLTGDQPAAEDLVQETFLRLSERRPRLDEVGFAAYARRTIVNMRTSALRRMLTERRVLTSRSEPVPPGDPAGVVALSDVQAALLTLPIQQRACLALRYYEGFKEREIAEILGVSLASVKKNVERGMKKLAGMLGDEVGS